MKIGVKRVWVTLFVLAVLCASLTACGGDGSEETISSAVPTQEPVIYDELQEAATPTEAPQVTYAGCRISFLQPEVQSVLCRYCR